MFVMKVMPHRRSVYHIFKHPHFKAVCQASPPIHRHYDAARIF